MILELEDLFADPFNGTSDKTGDRHCEENSTARTKTILLPLTCCHRMLISDLCQKKDVIYSLSPHLETGTKNLMRDTVLTPTAEK